MTNPGWIVVTEWKHGRHTLTTDTLLSVEGIRGKVKFRCYTFDGTDEWVDVYTDWGLRSISPNRIRRVYR